MSKNRILGLFGLLVTALYGVETFKMKEAGANFLSGTKIFPLMIITGTLVFSVMILMQDYIQNAEPQKLVLDRKVMKTIGICTAVFIGYTMVFNFLGYILSTILMLFALMSIINKGKIKQNAIVSVTFSIVAYAVFAKLLAISLPPGLIQI